MNILFIGDIMGRPGREYLQEYFHYLIVHYQIDFSIANIENAAGGFGLTPEIAEGLFSLGLNVLTSGVSPKPPAAFSMLAMEKSI